MTIAGRDKVNNPCTNNGPYKIGILLLPYFSNLDLGLITEPMFIANWLVQRKLFEWTTYTLDDKPVVASNGMRINADTTVSNKGECFAVFVLASFETRKYTSDKRIKDWLRHQAHLGAVLGGIQMGSEVLAATGLLNGYDAAIHWDNLEGFQELYPKVNVRAQLFTIQPRRLTCAGGTAVLDMMLRWFDELCGGDLAREVAQHMLVSRIRCPTGSEPDKPVAEASNTSEPVERAIKIMERMMEETISCGEIANMVGISRRQLERQFNQYAAMPPLKYYIQLRLTRAHRLLQQTDLSVAQVAASAGFESLEHFCRVYHHKFGRPPSADRLQSTVAPVMRQVKAPARK